MERKMDSRLLQMYGAIALASWAVITLVGTFAVVLVHA
jgi:hypothetical protein